MTQEDKDLLLKDLCARLPYGPVLKVRLIDNYDDMVERNIKLTQFNIGYAMSDSHWLDFKVYLRPMSSMTEEERQEYGLVLCDELSINQFDWLNKNMFDYRGLIEKGLAISIETFNPYKD